ncbi:MAG: tRNA (N6-threonylcarbamoyladenosine(37)-N6)-methyltransferase TrmO [Lachnospiraceae bacterium]|nr:tRNA (N6-threonylcarbamoyladenosine(37)-N6)-methyltransferase TrmO [Lachnospiraceae bacterium]
MQNIVMQAVGYVRNSVENKKDTAWGGDVSTIVLKEEFYGGLKGIEDFSHVIIIYYLDKAKYDKEKHLQRRPQNRDDMPLVGIFSQRGKDRPNRIGMTSVQIVSVDEKSITVKGLDAIDGTPVLDIKPYYPVYDKKDAVVPEWVTRLMENYF